MHGTMRQPQAMDFGSRTLVNDAVVVIDDIKLFFMGVRHVAQFPFFPVLQLEHFWMIVWITDP